jgi:hypothetical protein
MIPIDYHGNTVLSVVHKRQCPTNTHLPKLLCHFSYFLDKLKRENYQAVMKLTHDFETFHLRDTYNDTVPYFETLVQIRIPNHWGHNP